LKRKKRLREEKKDIKFGEKMKLNKTIEARDIPRHLISFPSQYHFMSNININKKKKK
jgi:hypothetical protein